MVFVGVQEEIRGVQGIDGVGAEGNYLGGAFKIDFEGALKF